MGRAGRSRGRHQREAGRSALSAPAHHPHDLDHVACAKRGVAVAIALDDLTVVLDRNRSRVDAQEREVIQQWRGLVQLHVLAVDLQRDHLNSVIAA